MRNPTGNNYTKVDQSYFDKRGLKRYAGVWSLWALGVERLFPDISPAGIWA